MRNMLESSFSTTAVARSGRHVKVKRVAAANNIAWYPSQGLARVVLSRFFDAAMLPSPQPWQISQPQSHFKVAGRDFPGTGDASMVVSALFP